MSLEILLVRHAESQGNVNGLFIGHTDVCLSELGFKQAQMLGEYLKNYEIDEIYSSDLKRAVQTVTPISEIKNLPIIKNQSLREIFGGKWEEVAFKDIGRLFPQDYNAYVASPVNGRPTDGESIYEVALRVKRATDEIVKNTRAKRIVICSHATSIRGLECMLLTGDMSKWEELEYPSNASVTIYSYQDGKYILKGRSIDHFMGDLVTRLPKEAK